MSAKKKETGGEIRYMRVKPVTNVLFSLVFILLALVCFMPALLVLTVSFSAESSVVSKGYSYWPNAWSLES